MPVKFDRRHYNALAKLFRDNWPYDLAPNEPEYAEAKRNVTIQRATLADFALEMTKYFEKGDPGFKPIKFLEAASAEPELYPLSELWED